MTRIIPMHIWKNQPLTRWRKLFILLLLSTSIYLAGFGVVRMWLGFKFDALAKQSNYTDFKTAILKADKLPDELYAAYLKVNDLSSLSSTNYLLAKTPFRLLGLKVKSEECPCFEVNYGFVVDFWDRMAVGIQLDKDAGRKKCFDYYFRHLDFGYSRKGPESAAMFYFGKPLAQLNDYELIELCVRAKNPVIFNKKDNPERLKREISKIMTRRSS